MSLYCPHCDRPLEGHDAGHCARRMSRRFFFGLCAGAAATAAVAPAATKYIECANGAKIAYDPRILLAGDRLTVNFSGNISQLADVCVLAEIEESGEKRLITSVARDGQQFYIAPQKMRISKVRWNANVQGAHKPSITVVRE